MFLLPHVLIKNRTGHRLIQSSLKQQFQRISLNALHSFCCQYSYALALRQLSADLPKADFIAKYFFRERRLRCIHCRPVKVLCFLDLSFIFRKLLLYRILLSPQIGIPFSCHTAQIGTYQIQLIRKCLIFFFFHTSEAKQSCFLRLRIFCPYQTYHAVQFHRFQPSAHCSAVLSVFSAIDLFKLLMYLIYFPDIPGIRSDFICCLFLFLHQF